MTGELVALPGTGEVGVTPAASPRCPFGGHATAGCAAPAVVELYVIPINLRRLVCLEHAGSVLMLAGVDGDPGKARRAVVVERVFDELERVA